MNGACTCDYPVRRPSQASRTFFYRIPDTVFFDPTCAVLFGVKKFFLDIKDLQQRRGYRPVSISNKMRQFGMHPFFLGAFQIVALKICAFNNRIV
jgi:hypothetical protein